MSNLLVQQVANTFKKPAILDINTGDTVKVFQRIKEGTKERTQMFEGLVIRVRSKNSISASILVRKIASGVGVEKSFMLHSPSVEKIEIVKKSKVRRNYLTYIRSRVGKSARLSGISFDKEMANTLKEADIQTESVTETTEVPAETEASAEAEPMTDK
jgi:large subunit ribosomal protein L19